LRRKPKGRHLEATFEHKVFPPPEFFCFKGLFYLAPSTKRGTALEAARLAEGADDGDGVLVLGVDGVIEAADVSGGEFAGEIVKSGAKLGKLREG